MPSRRHYIFAKPGVAKDDDSGTGREHCAGAGFKSGQSEYLPPGLCNANVDVMKVSVATSPGTIPATRFV